MSLSDPSAAASAGAPGRPGRAETALLRAVLHILFGVWGLSAREVAPIVGGVPLRTLFHWRERPEAASIDVVLRYRLSALLGFYKALRQVYPDASGQREWLRTPDTGGRAPVAVLMDGCDREIRSLRDLVGGEPDGKRSGQ